MPPIYPAKAGGEFVAGSDWVSWHGGSSPVKTFESGTVRHRNGLQVQHLDLSACEWEHFGEEDDIVSYRKGDVLIESPEKINPAAAAQLYSALELARDVLSGLVGDPQILGPINRALKAARCKEE